jgi:uncharacterized protein YbjQ (UPF0145 family)
MIIVTTPYLPAIASSRARAWCSARRPQPRPGRQHHGRPRSLGGGEIHEYTSLLEDTRRQALDRLVRTRPSLGANAVVSMRFDSSELSGTMSEIVAYGTASSSSRTALRAPTRRAE